MKIERRISNNSSIDTSLHDLLELCKDSKEHFYNTEYEKREPLGIYNVASSEFLTSYLKLCNYIYENKEHRYQKIDWMYYSLLKELIGNFASLLDEIYFIFLSFYPISECKNKSRTASKKFESLEPIFANQYRESIKKAKTITEINNKIKHNNQRFASIIVKTQFKGDALGFFLESVSEDGELIPDKEIHKPFGGMYTAFSNTWFLYYILSLYYIICEDAGKILLEIINKKGIKLSLKVDQEINDRIRIIFNTLEKAKTNIVFENEYDLEIWSEIFMDNESIIVRNPASRTFVKRFQRYSSIKIEMKTSGDGVSKTYAIPYVGKPLKG